VAQARETWTVRRAPQSIGRSGVVFVLCWIMLAATPLAAQQNGGTVIETVATLSDRDVNGKDVVSEKVVTRRSGTSDGEDVVIEIYLPSIDSGGTPCSAGGSTASRRWRESDRRRDRSTLPRLPGRPHHASRQPKRDDGAQERARLVHQRAARVRTGREWPVRARRHGDRAHAGSVTRELRHDPPPIARS
jgi:hypothetical protein